MLQEDKEIWKRMEPEEIASSRAQALGKDGSGLWHYHFESLESRLYSLASPWRPKPLPEVPHLVRVGERIEVEVEEVKGQIEWRQAEVTQLLGGGKGRFAVVVDGADGARDEDFVEVFTAPLMGKEWRKIPGLQPIGKGGRKTRVSEPSAKKAKLDEHAAAASTTADGRSLTLLQLRPTVQRLKGSKMKADKTLHEAVAALGESQETHAAAEGRLRQQSVVKLHAEVLAAATEAEAAKQRAIDDEKAEAEAEAAAAAAAVAAAAEAEAEVEAATMRGNVSASGGNIVAAAEAKQIARAARAVAREAVAAREFAAAEEPGAARAPPAADGAGGAAAVPEEAAPEGATSVARHAAVAEGDVAGTGAVAMFVDPPTDSAQTDSAGCSEPGAGVARAAVAEATVAAAVPSPMMAPVAAPGELEGSAVPAPCS